MAFKNKLGGLFGFGKGTEKEDELNNKTTTGQGVK